ncbi:acyltransferase family protein [Duganella radicis]|uniref:Acyltransferase family protein n=1 Tax=Duganella radicis TaxID=551988 RepID=A0A6L6PR17_9BURK|nr:acyltransferase family protein [Duganella radicis]MTV41548.1 acyltransferase family protein [Duganella radicis]
MTHPTSELKYRPDIDGLRAVAVIAVVLYHSFPTWFVSGFIGVDVFFVISGYLISTIIMGQLERGSFSLADFYSRRIRRIFPALTTVLLATLLFGWAVLLHGEFRQIGKHVAAGGGFVSNLVLWWESGYFDNAANTKPLLHLWSLGVEEQFYLVWPLILWLLFARRMNFLLITAVIFVLSMAANVLSIDTSPSAVFFSPLTRFWELMSGGVAAYLHLHHRPWSARQQGLASGAGALLLLAGFALIKPQMLFPGWWAALPVLGAFLLIMAGPGAWCNRLLLSRKAAVWIGLISYPLYLWHWPLISYSYILFGEKPPYQVKFAVVAAAFVLAAATYRLLELPLRAVTDKKRVVGGLAGAMVALSVAGLAISAGMVKERIDAHGADIYLNALNDSDFPGPLFVPLRHDGITFQKLSSPGKGLTVFLGDSVMQQYGPYVEQQVREHGAQTSSIIFATAGGCPPIPGVIRLPLAKFPRCRQAVDAAYALAAGPAVDTVVIGAAWNGYFQADNSNLQIDDGGARLTFPQAPAMEAAYQSLQRGMAALRARGKRVVLVLQPPSGDAYDPRRMYTGSRWSSIHPLPEIRAVALDRYQADNAAPLARLRAIAQQTGAELIDPSQFLCAANACPVLDASGQPLYTDPIHMRPAYVKRAAAYLRPAIDARG